jgi:Pyruvate/2-oxoacid:ferredoxin oxidoreductase delta subunit
VQGRRAAEEIHERLYGVTSRTDTTESIVHHDQLSLSQYADVPRTSPPTVPPQDRIASLISQMHETLTEDAFFQEASRCLSCGACFGCQTCKMYCNPGGFMFVESPKPGMYFELNLALCEGCTKCIELCPCGAIQ